MWYSEGHMLTLNSHHQYSSTGDGVFRQGKDHRHRDGGDADSDADHARVRNRLHHKDGLGDVSVHQFIEGQNKMLTFFEPKKVSLRPSPPPRLGGFVSRLRVELKKKFLCL